jgi:hypothetical protein
VDALLPSHTARYGNHNAEQVPGPAVAHSSSLFHTTLAYLAPWSRLATAVVTARGSIPDLGLVVVPPGYQYTAAQIAFRNQGKDLVRWKVALGARRAGVISRAADCCR